MHAAVGQVVTTVTGTPAVAPDVAVHHVVASHLLVADHAHAQALAPVHDHAPEAPAPDLALVLALALVPDQIVILEPIARQ